MSPVKRYGQLALVIIAGGAVYPLVYLRQNFEITLLEAFGISGVELRDIFSLLGLIFVLTYVPSGWLADRFSPRKLMAFSLA
ncbi:MAG TPA: MFS transporter, partial [Gammaproteobacteria bacterium]|nr:MFS transporter [Gammaproteobacteria bacterium]